MSRTTRERREMKEDNRQNVKISNSLRHFLMHKKPRDLSVRRKSMLPWLSRPATGHVAASDLTVTTLWIQALCCAFMRVLGLDLVPNSACGVALIFFNLGLMFIRACRRTAVSISLALQTMLEAGKDLKLGMEPDKNLGVFGQLLFPHHSRTSSEETSLSLPWIPNSYPYVNSFDP